MIYTLKVRSREREQLVEFTDAVQQQLTESGAREGVCTICHVRLRPQVFNTVRRNEEIVQCDSCNRILYFVPVQAAAPSGAS